MCSVPNAVGGESFQFSLLPDYVFFIETDIAMDDVVSENQGQLRYDFTETVQNIDFLIRTVLRRPVEI